MYEARQNKEKVSRVIRKQKEERKKISEIDGNQQTYQFYKVGYRPDLKNLKVPTGGENQNYSQATFQRPSGWYEGTLDELFRRAKNDGHVETVKVFNQEVTMILCGASKTATDLNSVDIGHIIPWKNYVASTEPNNMREAINAYNDLQNLRLEASTPNRSGDFEQDFDGNYKMDKEERALQNTLGLPLDKYDMQDNFIDDTFMSIRMTNRALNELQSVQFPHLTHSIINAYLQQNPQEEYEPF